MQTVYIGPSKKNWGLVRNRVYWGGLPPYITEKIKEYPELERLFVPVEELDRKLLRSMRQGTPENRAYAFILEAQ